MTPQRKSVALRTADKVRRLVNRAGFEVTRDPTHEFVNALHAHDVTAVLDIGANIGQFAEALRATGFSGRIHSVEPLQQAYDTLSARAQRDPNWTAERAAVSDAPGTVQMNVSENSVSSSVLPMRNEHADAAPQSRYVATEEVPATTVDDIIARTGLDPATTLLKIDVQGYEKAVLDGAVATLPAFVGVRTELSLTSLYDGQALLPEVVTYLGGHGLNLWFIEPGFRDPRTRRLLQLDGTFFRA